MRTAVVVSRREHGLIRGYAVDAATWVAVLIANARIGLDIFACFGETWLVSAPKIMRLERVPQRANK